MLSEEALNIIADTGGWAGSPQDITEMARELLALRWTPITPENLPKMGDEIWNTLSSRVEVVLDWMPQFFANDHRLWIKSGWTHRRPLTPPRAQKP
jgi:hypothetical protein